LKALKLFIHFIGSLRTWVSKWFRQP